MAQATADASLAPPVAEAVSRIIPAVAAAATAIASSYCAIRYVEYYIWQIPSRLSSDQG
jgi:hypothetical protein